VEINCVQRPRHDFAGDRVAGCVVVMTATEVVVARLLVVVVGGAEQSAGTAWHASA
jgi:hypothetical protein